MYVWIECAVVGWGWLESAAPGVSVSGAAFAGCRGPQSDAQRQRSRFMCAGSLRIYRRLLRVLVDDGGTCFGVVAAPRHWKGVAAAFLPAAWEVSPAGNRGGVSCRAEFPGIGARLPASHPGNSGAHPSPLSTLPGNRCSCVMTCNRCGGPPLSLFRTYRAEQFVEGGHRRCPALRSRLRSAIGASSLQAAAARPQESRTYTTPGSPERHVM
ncbi:hypothetical protein HPB51_010113 [Rhipicephalus microplus]|uniref:Uncharacterized protein n=1 Tax=Rhipicephalus microplus TaxID=6941 RepID=A0A9J6F1Y1_RHIMP|nr:hypothetical protein HPB51_010113 [Rhipicephalus microplus]